MRKLVWKAEKTFQGWGCSDCDFKLPYAKPMDTLADYAKETRRIFDRHSCVKNSKK